MFAKILISIGISVVIYFAIAIGLILSQPLRPLAPTPAEGLAFETVIAAGQAGALESGSFTARDGTELSYGWVKGPEGADAPLVVMIHGSGWYGGQWDRLAAKLGDVAEVKTLTLRGHGADPLRRGDLDYIGQFEDDIADLLAGEDPARKVLVVGHSSGGGLAVRFAGGRSRRAGRWHGADRALLAAQRPHDPAQFRRLGACLDAAHYSPVDAQ